MQSFLRRGGIALTNGFIEKCMTGPGRLRCRTPRAIVVFYSSRPLCARAVFRRQQSQQLAAQLTCVILAHSLTLGLATLSSVRLPTAIVEPLIALSVAYVAVENILVGTGGSHRPAIVFLFGLIHGLGFADALGEAGVILCAARRSSTKPT